MSRGQAAGNLTRVLSKKILMGRKDTSVWPLEECPALIFRGVSGWMAEWMNKKRYIVAPGVPSTCQAVEHFYRHHPIPTLITTLAK